MIYDCFVNPSINTMMVHECNSIYDKLKFTDDFMFGAVLTTHLDICRELLELILNVKIRKVKLAQSQKSIKKLRESKGIRLDVYLDDDLDTVYDIEMQTEMKSNLPKRSRYYQGMIDLNIIKKGDDYDCLHKSYVIFICMSDPFKMGRHIYIFENMCRNVKTPLALNDGTYKVFLNADGTEDDVSEEMVAFLKYLKDGTTATEFTRKVDAAFEEMKESKELRGEYMTLLMRDREKYNEGLKQGIEQGREMEKKSTIISLIKAGVSIERIAEALGLSVDQVKIIVS